MENIKEGDLYKSIKIDDKTFDIYYGYYSEAERSLWEPAPIFPDFLKTSVYTNDGKPYARADQDICEHYSPKHNVSGEEWCNDCKHFELKEEVLGICKCNKKKRKIRKNE